MVCRNFDKICISLKMGCYMRHTLEVNLIFNLTLKYIKTVIKREKNLHKIKGEKSMFRLVSATIILCQDGDFAPYTTCNIGQISECSVKCKNVL